MNMHRPPIWPYRASFLSRSEVTDTELLLPPATIVKRTRARLRQILLMALGDVNWPLESAKLRIYCAARYGAAIAPRHLDRLVEAELGAWRQGARHEPIICYGLSGDRFEPIMRLYGRSDWPLERRIEVPTAGRVRHLEVTARLCDLALNAEETAADPEALRFAATDHARGLPGALVRRGTFALAEWREAALAALEALRPRDDALRREAADRLRRHARTYQLFGVPETLGDATLVSSSEEVQV